MGLTELFIIAVGLSMDAFAVSICKGLSLGKIKFKHMCIAGLWFGGFQALMPAIGYFLGSFFADMVSKYAHWVAFILLAIIGGNMIKESFSCDCDSDNDASFNFKNMFRMENVIYEAPVVEVIEVEVEKGFAMSTEEGNW